MRKTLYAILGLEPTATDEDINRAYEKLRAQTDSADTMRMLALREAWTTLSDPARRARYDKNLEAVAPDHRVLIYDTMTPRMPWAPSILLGCAVLAASWFALHRQADTINLPPTAAGPAAAQNQGGVVTGTVGGQSPDGAKQAPPAANGTTSGKVADSAQSVTE